MEVSYWRNVIQMNLKIAIGIVLASGLTIQAGTPAIGLVQAAGEFRLNHATTYGNGTLLEGAILETGTARSDISLSSGGHIAIAPNSKTTVYKDHAVLQSGAAEVNAPNFKVVASKLSISGSGAQVVFDSPTKIRVGALSTPVEVRNSSNMLLARVAYGSPLSFDEGAGGGGQGGASGPVTITGTLQKSGNKYTITDDTTNVTYEVQGKDLDKKVGKKVKVAGAIIAGSGAVPVVTVSSIAIVGAAAAAGGLSTAAIAGIVVAGATGLGLGIAGATGAFDSSSK